MAEDYPVSGQKIAANADGTLNVPNNPIVPYIEGDGIGPDIWRAAMPVVDGAVQRAYEGQRQIAAGRHFHR